MAAFSPADPAFERPDTPLDDESPVKKHRKDKYEVPDEAKAWFMGFAEVQRRLHGWTVAKSWQKAKQLAPEIYGRCNDAVCRRWKPKPLVETRGRKAKLGDAVRSMLSQLVFDLVQRVPLSCVVIHEILLYQLSEAGIHVEISFWWTYGA